MIMSPKTYSNIHSCEHACLGFGRPSSFKVAITISGISTKLFLSDKIIFHVQDILSHQSRPTFIACVTDAFACSTSQLDQRCATIWIWIWAIHVWKVYSHYMTMDFSHHRSLWNILVWHSVHVIFLLALSAFLMLSSLSIYQDNICNWHLWLPKLSTTLMN